MPNRPHNPLSRPLTHNPFADALQPISGRPAPWTPNHERAQAMALVDLCAWSQRMREEMQAQVLVILEPVHATRNAAGRLIDARTKRFV